MTDKEQEIKEIVKKFERLHIQQAALVDRLKLLQARQDNRGSRDRNVPSSGATTATVREFVIGDRVRVKNPLPFQSPVGTISNIGRGRITVTDRKKKTLQRAPHNLTLILE